MELLGIGPNWLVIWLVTWSLKHRVLPSVMAGMALGLIADGLTSAYPSHIISLVLVAFLTARMHRHRPIQDSMIAAVWIVFAMALLGETVLAIQYGLEGISPIEDIWKDYQRIALSSALLSSLWAPVLYYPLSRWWINRAG
jgi:rod shape-determining protein MreD